LAVPGTASRRGVYRRIPKVAAHRTALPVGGREPGRWVESPRGSSRLACPAAPARLGTNSIQTLEVFERREPILLVGHDADDKMWHLIGPTSADLARGRVGHLWHAVDEDPTLVDVLDLPPGHSAYRTHVGGPWTRQVGYPSPRQQ
jgi:hypothetical protein